MSTELETRVATLEREVEALKQLISLNNREKDWESTFGMFANDPGFEEVVRLGREYRERDREPEST